MFYSFIALFFPVGLLEKHGSALLIFVVALSSLISLYNLGASDLNNWDEAWYAAVSRDTAASGGIYPLVLEGQPWYDKPPLFIWAQMASFGFLGYSSFAARLPSALAGIALLVAVYLFAKKEFGVRAGLLAWLLLQSSPLFSGGTEFDLWSHGIRSASMDAPMILFGFFSLVLLFYSLQKIGAERLRLLVFSSVFLVASFYTKGGECAIFLSAGLLYFGWKALQGGKNRKETLGLAITWAAIFAALIFPYFAFNLISNHDSFLQGMVGAYLGNVGRLTATPLGAALAVASILLPWLVICPSAFLWAANKMQKKGAAADALALCAALCTGAAAFFLSMMVYSWYLLPFFVPACIICGAWLSDYFGDFSTGYQRLWLVIVLAAAAVFIAAILFSGQKVVRAEPQVVNMVLEHNYLGAKSLYIERNMRTAWYNEDGSLLEGDRYYLSFLPPDYKIALMDRGEMCIAASEGMQGFYWMLQNDSSCAASLPKAAYFVLAASIKDNHLLNGNTSLFYVQG